MTRAGPGRPHASLATALVALAALSGCTSAASPSDAGQETLTVSAASSLTEAFTAIADRFMTEHPGVRVSLNFGGSSALAEQVVSGAPVDVFASASRATMDAVSAVGAAEPAVAFARNEMVVVTPADNPAGVSTLADLADPRVRVAVCADEVPCGAATSAVLANADLAVTPVTLDPDVKSVLGRVVADEVDAGLVYVSDALAAGSQVVAIGIPADVNVSTDYLIARTSEAPEPTIADDFIAAVTGPGGQQELAARGFLTP